jgi:predicted Zn-ribbon and HTH transcriptional regulator
MSGRTPGASPSPIPEEPDSRLRERMQQAERTHELRPGALCPHCGGHAFKRAELKAGSPCPACGKSPRVAA